MNFFKNFFNKNPSETRFAMIEERGNGFYTCDGRLYKSDIIRTCIRPKVKAIGKLLPQHIRNDKEGFKVNPEPYIRFLLEEPNPYMSGQMFFEKMATQLSLNNNAFALLVKDENGYPMEMYNIPCVGVEALYDKQGELYLRFNNKNGKIVTFPYKDIIHLRQDFNENDVFGESNKEALMPLMEVVGTIDKGIINAVRNSNVIRWLLKFNTTLRAEDLNKQVEDFTNQFLNTKNTGGAAGVDSKAEAIQVDPKDYVPNAAQMDRNRERIYSFFNTNEKIVQSKYNEDEWNAYYESEIEPLAMQLSNEFTRKLFTRRERGFGNKILFTANNLQYASMSTKLGLQAMVDRGSMTPNEWREILNLPPISEGDKPIRRLDTAIVNTQNMRNSYAKNIVNSSPKTYAIDFDGTLCKKMYPKIGAPIEETIEYVKQLKNDGNNIILWTCRTGDKLQEAINWCEDKGIKFDAINENLEDNIKKYNSDSRKIIADWYVDDKAKNINEII